MRDSKVWLAAAGIVIKGQEVLVVKKTYGGLKGKWSFPAGFVQAGETVDEAAVREVKEETGITATVREVAAIRSGVIREDVSDNMVIFIMDYVSGEPTPQAGEIETAVFIPIEEMITHPLGTEYMRIILPHVNKEQDRLVAREYMPNPIFGYTKYKIFTQLSQNKEK